MNPIRVLITRIDALVCMWSLVSRQIQRNRQLWSTQRLSHFRFQSNKGKLLVLLQNTQNHWEFFKEFQSVDLLAAVQPLRSSPHSSLSPFEYQQCWGASSSDGEWTHSGREDRECLSEMRTLSVSHSGHLLIGWFRDGEQDDSSEHEQKRVI